jgi:hypothetical protein
VNNSMSRSIGVWCVCAVLCSAVAHGELGAQDSSGVDSGRWLWAVSVGVPGFEDQAIGELFTVGANFTQMRLNKPSLDFSLGTVPRALAEGFIALGLRGGLALPLVVSPAVLIVPSGGVSLLAAAGSGGAATLTGANAGVAAVLSDAHARSGVRIGMSWHKFQDVTGGLWLIELGLARIPSRRR